MGLAQISSVYYYGDRKPNFSRFQSIGLHQNEPVGARITDSASGATAFSIGKKTYNGAIGVDRDTIPRETILEWAAKKGKSTGVVATSSITHATPASFYAHVKSRIFAEDIALDLVKSPVDFAAGGGYQYFSQRSDGKDLLGELRSRGVEVDTNGLGRSFTLGKRYAYFLAADALPSMRAGRGDFLPEATDAALKLLSQDPDGFFLMIEGSQIDWGGHGNQSEYIITETLDFDKAIGKALDFAKKDGNTLVVVTADHETGGYALSAPVLYGQADYGNISPTFSTGGHTASLIPVFAYGPGAERFMGVYQNNEIYDKMMAAWK
jgi:alkaline phosphatase